MTVTKKIRTPVYAHAQVYIHVQECMGQFHAVIYIYTYSTTTHCVIIHMRLEDMKICLSV